VLGDRVARRQDSSAGVSSRSASRAPARPMVPHIAKRMTVRLFEEISDKKPALVVSVLSAHAPPTATSAPTAGV